MSCQMFHVKRFKKKEGELWYDSSKTDKIVRTVEPGIRTTHQQRNWMNMRFLQKANEVLPVDHIYFAGACGALHNQIERRTMRRLMSYHVIKDSSTARRVFEMHMKELKHVTPK